MVDRPIRKLKDKDTYTYIIAEEKVTLKELCPHAPTEIIPESSPLLGSEESKPVSQRVRSQLELGSRNAGEQELERPTQCERK